MRILFCMVGIALIYLMGAISHEYDMANNCARSGNAKAWVNDIKCELVKGNG